MSYQARRILTPGGASRKRKEGDVFFSSTSTKPFTRPTAVSLAVSVTNQATTSFDEAEPEQQPFSSNRVLAGYMAHEFLNKGTLFGQKFDSARADVSLDVEFKRINRQRQSQVQPIDEAAEPQRYAEVANLLKSERSHIPGIVNPTQLARWIQM